MAFKKNQRVASKATGIELRVESGPWPIATGDESYLVERLTDRAYVLTLGKNLRPIVPRQGDMGNIRWSSGNIGSYGPYELIYLDSKVVLVLDKDEDYQVFKGSRRDDVLNGWEPVDD